MSVKRTPIEKAAERVNMLSLRKTEASAAFSTKQRVLKQVHSWLDAHQSVTAHANMAAAKRTAELKAEAARVRKEVRSLRSATRKSMRDIYVAELRMTVLVDANKQKEEAKTNAEIVKKLKKGQFSDPLLQKINRLPEDVVNFISTFLPDDVVFDIRVREFENRKATKSLLSRCEPELKARILHHFSTVPEFLSVLPWEERYIQIREIEGQVNPSWNAYYWVWSNSMLNVKILNLINMAKASNPKFAYEILRWFHILIDTTKKYKLKYNSYQYNVLTDDHLFYYNAELHLP